MWRMVKPAEAKRVPGTSSDLETFNNTFGQRHLTSADAYTLRAMHRAVTHPFSTNQETLWGTLADALERLPESAEIEVWGEY